MTDKTCNYFEELNKINVNDHIEKKGGFNYLSWPFAVSELRKHHPEATWEVKRFNGLPYLQTPTGYFVEVEVVVNGIAMSQIHPVLDNRNQVIKEPTVFHINTSIQRCLVKAIALHGLGLYIYAGEDLPIDDEPQQEAPKPVSQPAKPTKNNYVQKAVQAFVKTEQAEQQKPFTTPPSIDELKEIFGDDIQIVDETPFVTEDDLKVIKNKCKATGVTTQEQYGQLYKMIRDSLGIQIFKGKDFETMYCTDFDRLIAFLDSKKQHFVAA